jgi:hypothetical protein
MVLGSIIRPRMTLTPALASAPMKFSPPSQSAACGTFTACAISNYFTQQGIAPRFPGKENKESRVCGGPNE